MNNLRQHNIQLKESLDRERLANANVRQLEIALEEEQKRKAQAEKELEKIRSEFYEGQAFKTQESENMKRAIEDFKYQQEESLRVINLKDQEILFLQKDLTQLRELIDRGQEDNEGLKRIISELEAKNRRLNDKLNHVIYNKAAAYKEKTL